MGEIIVLAFLACLTILATLGVASLRITKSVSGLVSATGNASASDSVGVIANPTSVLAAQPGVVTTHTNNTSGTLTMNNPAHGIITGQHVDLYWTGGQIYQAVVGTVSGTSVPIASVGGGTAFPAATTTLNVGIAQSAPFNVVGDNMSALVLSTPNTGYFVFDDGASGLVAIKVTGGFVYDWETGNTDTNPLAGVTYTLVWMSHSNTAAATPSMQAAAVTH